MQMKKHNKIWSLVHIDFQAFQKKLKNQEFDKPV